MTWTTQQRSEGAGDLAFVRQGNGPALVLIHGVGLRGEAWGGVLPLLNQHFTLFAVDMPGHGLSPMAGAGTLDDYVDRLQAFVAALDGPVHVAGHSMGAILALLLAGRAPGKVASVSALNAIYRRDPAAQQAVMARAAALAAEGPSDPAATLERWFGKMPSAAMAEAADACRDWLLAADPDGYATAYQLFAEQDGPADDLLSSLPMPALFMTGAKDPNSTPEMSHAMARLTPEGEAISLSDAAHMMPMTHPDALAKALVETCGKAGR